MTKKTSFYERFEFESSAFAFQALEELKFQALEGWKQNKQTQKQMIQTLVIKLSFVLT